MLPSAQAAHHAALTADHPPPLSLSSSHTHTDPHTQRNIQTSCGMPLPACSAHKPDWDGGSTGEELTVASTTAGKQQCQTKKNSRRERERKKEKGTHDGEIV